MFCLSIVMGGRGIDTMSTLPPGIRWRPTFLIDKGQGRHRNCCNEVEVVQKRHIAESVS